MTRAIAISGALGSGKSSVAKLLAERLGLEYVSTGDLQRSIARKRSLTTLELNKAAESDQRIDDEVDDVLRGLAAEGTPVVVDSRMAWWFIPQAMSVHLTVAPEVAAQRMHARQGQAAETYSSPAEAMRLAADRADSERVRFRSLYGVDTARLRNYELVVDTTSAPAEATAEEIVAAYAATADPEAARPVRMVLSPRTVYPTRPDPSDDGPLRVGFSYPYFFVVDGHRALASAIAAGSGRIDATLCAEEAEDVGDGRTAQEAFAAAVGLLDRWGEATGVRLPEPAGAG